MINAVIIGQLSLMQSVVVTLPDEKSIFSFVCRGLADFPGVTAVQFTDVFQRITAPQTTKGTTTSFPILANQVSHGSLLFTLSDPQAFSPYEEYLNNFCVMLAVILDERNERRQNELAKIELENQVQERTRDLHLSEQFLLDSQEVAETGSWALNLQTNQLTWTTQSYRNFGVSPDTYSPSVDSILALVHPEDRTAMQTWIGATQAGEDAGSLEFRVRHPDGTIIILEGRGRLIRDDNNRPVRMIGTNHNITERRRVEADLAESRERFRAVIEAEPECVKILNAQGRLQEMNPAGLRIIEADSFEQVRNQCIYPIINESHRNAFIDLTKRVLQGESGTLQFEITGLNGGHKWLETSMVPLYDLRDKTKPYGSLGITRDITQRKAAEEKLKNSESKLRRAQELFHVGNWEWNLSTNGLTWSEETFRIYGFDPHEITPDYDLVVKMMSPKSKDEFREKIAASLRDKQPFEMDYSFVRRDGAEATIHTIGVVIVDADGTPIKLEGTIQDITDQKNQEESLQMAKESAEQANRTKDLFLATLSHELRTPLTAILSWSQMIKSGRLDAGRFQKGIEVIEQSALNQSRLINDLLDVSRIASGKLLLDCRQISPVQIVASEINTIASLVSEKKIEVIQDIDPIVTTVFADPARLHQILWNLLGNAIKFSAHGGKIWVTLRRKGLYAEFIIRDNGAGIPPKFLGHIFDRFAQADSSSTRHHGGLGLGLAISSNLIRMMGGTIKAESPGKGSGATFTFQLPIQPPAIRPESAFGQTLDIKLVANPPNQEALNRTRGMKILCVDDDSATLEAIKMVLESFGAVVRPVLSGKQAIEALVEFTPDLIVSDIAMPDLDGYGLLEAVRAMPSEKDKQTPVIALTAYAGPEDQKHATEAGFNGYLAKPVDANVLLQTVARLARKVA